MAQTIFYCVTQRFRANDAAIKDLISFPEAHRIGELIDLSNLDYSSGRKSTNFKLTCCFMITQSLGQISYNATANHHSLHGAKLVLEEVFAEEIANSLLDVGCGPGFWLRAAGELGVSQLVGVDGLNNLGISGYVGKFILLDLRKPFKLGSKFDLVLCLEVAEHLDEEYAGCLIESLVRHSDRIAFSAARPGQEGDHHVNLQWPQYWQTLFNYHGFTCCDSIRWRIWENAAIEPWYRQNIFIAVRNPSQAGAEPRLPSVIHPSLFTAYHEYRSSIEQGFEHPKWYLAHPPLALYRKLLRYLAISRTSPHRRGTQL